MSSRLRAHLAAEVAKAVRQHGIVVWDDPAREYQDVAAEVVPEGTIFVAFSGSWYRLRHQVESLLGGPERPALLIYVPTGPPPEDPLAEVRAAGRGGWKLRLDTCLRQALGSELPGRRIEELTKACTTFSDAEAAVAAGVGDDLRLVDLLSAADHVVQALGLLEGRFDSRIDAADGWPQVADVLVDRYGGDLHGSGEELRVALLRHLVLLELSIAAGGELGGGLPTATSTTDQARRAQTLLDALRRPERWAAYVKEATAVDSALALPERLEWSPSFAPCPGTPGLDEIAFREACRLLGVGEVAAAQGLAEARTSLLWSDSRTGKGWADRSARWASVAATARLLGAVAAHPVPTGDPYRWYADGAWRVDAAHRAFEKARLQLALHGPLEALHGHARREMSAWLDGVCRAATAWIAEHGVGGGIVAQTATHEAHVAGRQEAVAYIWVDALRLEMGHDLAAQLADSAEEVSVEAAVAAAPTITPVGMAALTCTRLEQLRLTIEADALVVRVGGVPVATPADRLARIRAAHPSVIDLTLEQAASMGEGRLAEAVTGAGVVVVRSTEIDAAGERGQLGVGWSTFSTTLNLLTTLVPKLGAAGVGTVVVAADHGFLAPPQSIGADRVLDVPLGGKGELHRRGWVGTGANTPDGAVRVPLEALGVGGGLDLITPSGLALFRGGGARQFFHGGLAPQEALVPVVVARLPSRRASAAAPAPSVEVAVAGGRITTRTFAATVTFPGDLFASRGVTVRGVAQRAGGAEVVAEVLDGDGFDADRRTATIPAGATAQFVFKVLAGLAKGEKVDVEVVEASTGVRLGGRTVSVAVALPADEDL